MIGVVSDRDLLRALSPYVGGAAETNRDLATLIKRVHQIMTRRPLTLRPQSASAEPVGILSWRDLLKSLAVG
ncbi:MAG: CBS domain-containing protein [Steroidobacteraceae bacterium]